VFIYLTLAIIGSAWPNTVESAEYSKNQMHVPDQLTLSEGV
jgi:hypothetical protein